jgi:hypothetical protein
MSRETAFQPHAVRRDQAVRTLASLLALAVALGCAARTPEPFRPEVTAVDIVRQNASDAFATFLDRTADRSSMQSFQTRIASARTRDDLTTAWNQVPGLAAKGSTFLQEQVFIKAIGEARWPAQPLVTLEAAFVQGVRDATNAFLTPGGA